MLIDRWMLQKMQDAERLNEANSLYEEMVDRLKASGLEKLAQLQVDGVVRQSEEGAEYFLESSSPSSCKHKISAHEGGCASTIFENNSSRLISYRSIKLWDTNSEDCKRKKESNSYGERIEEALEEALFPSDSHSPLVVDACHSNDYLNNRCRSSNVVRSRSALTDGLFGSHSIIT